MRLKRKNICGIFSSGKYRARRRTYDEEKYFFEDMIYEKSGKKNKRKIEEEERSGLTKQRDVDAPYFVLVILPI